MKMRTRTTRPTSMFGPERPTPIAIGDHLALQMGTVDTENPQCHRVPKFYEVQVFDHRPLLRPGDGDERGLPNSMPTIFAAPAAPDGGECPGAAMLLDVMSRTNPGKRECKSMLIEAEQALSVKRPRPGGGAVKKSTIQGGSTASCRPKMPR